MSHHEQKSIALAAHYLSNAAVLATQTGRNSPPPQSQSMTEEEVSAMRTDLYLPAMEKWESNQTRVGWLLAFSSFIELIETTMTETNQKLLADNQTPLDSVTVDLQINGKVYQGVKLEKGSFRTMGRIPFTDYPVENLNGFSRLHMILCLLGTKVVAIDVGSCMGIIAKERLGKNGESSGPLEQSVRGNRRVLIFDPDEHVILELGSVKVIINPKECELMLCDECTGFRNFRGDCGHYVCCLECAEALYNHSDRNRRKCPICREAFFGSNEARGVVALRTHVNNEN